MPRSYLVPLLVILGLSWLPRSASAGPYASSAMGDAAYVSLPTSFHLGGSFGGAFGRSQGTAAHSVVGGGFIEVRMADILVLGLEVDARTLPALPERIGDRLSSVRLRAGFRAPLVSQRSLHERSWVPVLALRGSVGGGWLGGEPRGAPGWSLVLGGEVAFEVVTQRRIGPFMALGFDALRVDGSRVRQGVFRVGFTVHLGGRRVLAPSARGRAEPEPVGSTAPERSSRRRLLDHLQALDDDD